MFAKKKLSVTDMLALLAACVVIGLELRIASEAALQDAKPFSLDVAVGSGEVRTFRCGKAVSYSDASDCEMKAVEFCDSIKGGDPTVCKDQLLAQVRWRKPHLSLAIPGKRESVDAALKCNRVKGTAVWNEESMSILRKISGRKVERILIVSFYTGKNFGDRLGVQILNALLPARAQLHHVGMVPCEGRPLDRCPDISLSNVVDGNFDLIVIGTGMSMYRASLTEELFEIVRTVPFRIGIFGTQYHATVPERAIRTLVDMMDIWFARYRDDVVRYGNARSTIHLGDWMISSCPLRVPSFRRDDAALYVPPNVLYDEVALDRYIEGIQSVAFVFSGRLHPLLCSLPSASAVAYAEQREHGEAGSGKFLAMLSDIFGPQYFPENSWLGIDRSCVVEYKKMISDRMEIMRKTFSSWVSSSTRTKDEHGSWCMEEKKSATRLVVRPVYYQEKERT